VLEPRTAFFGGFDLFSPLYKKKEKKYPIKVKKGQNRQKKRFLEFVILYNIQKTGIL